MYPELARLTLRASLCAVPLLASAATAAEDPPAPPREGTAVQPGSDQATPTLGEVVVSAPRERTVPESSSVGTAELSRLRPATSDAASLLRDVPGVSLYGAGGASSLPAIRGLADDRLRIKVDGMDLVASCPNHMNPPLSYLDPTNVSKLTVYAGITPVSVGGDSIGGTIIAETAPPRFAEPGEGTLYTGEIGGFYRSNGDAYGGNVSLTAATEGISLTYTGAYAESDNYEAGGDFKEDSARGRATGRIGHTLPLDEVGSTAYRTQTQTLGAAFRSGNHLVEAELGLQNVPEQLYPNQRMDMLDNEQKRFNLRYRGQFDWGLLDARAFYEEVDHFMDFGPDKRFWYGPGKPPAGSGGDVGFDLLGNGYPCSPISGSRMVNKMMVGCAAGMPMYTESETLGATVTADIELSERDLLRVGAQYLGYQLDDWWTASGAGMWPGTFDNINDGERDRLGVFAEWEARIGDEWLALLGARYERVKSDAGDVRGYSTAVNAGGGQYADAAAFNARDRERTDDNVDLTALGRYSVDPSLDIELGVARKVRSPNLYERYTWSTWSMAAVMNNFVGDGNGYIGNLDLEPEKAYTVSATFDWHATDRSWEIAVTPYYTRVVDYIDAVRCTKGVACTAANATATDQFVVLQYENHSARLYGVDLSGQVPLARNDWGEFGLTGLVSYTNGKNRDTDDGLYNIMPLNAKVALTHRLGGWDNAVEWVGAMAKDDVSEVRNEIETPGYGLLNLRASYAWKHARVDVGVENLFDRLYDLPLGGAYVGQGTTMALNGIPWGIAVPGMGRSIYAGVTLKY
jgi:iron complex outermembrane receptor protein